MREHRWRFRLFRVIDRPADGRKAANAGDDRAVMAAGTMDDQQLAVHVPASDDADVFIAGIKHKVAG